MAVISITAWRSARLHRRSERGLALSSRNQYLSEEQAEHARAAQHPRALAAGNSPWKRPVSVWTRNRRSPWTTSRRGPAHSRVRRAGSPALARGRAGRPPGRRQHAD
ncbi:pantoate--beta-alanine ligase [Kocuria rhizophila]|nr:pantoate--beta-alanine ligase [Kocuria rhizophila]